MNNEHWLLQLNTLLVKYSHMGINTELASLTLIDAWGLYLYLVRLAEA